MRIAFATYATTRAITADDQLLADALALRGAEVHGIPWDAAEDWTRYDAVVVRSTWDFHHRLPEFREWIQRLEADGVRLVNPSRLVTWNLTKRYLAELEAEGVPIVPTHWITSAEQGSDISLAGVASARGWNGGIVVKPIVSASAHDTWVARGDDRDGEDDRLRGSLARSAHGVMLQPFLPEIAAKGEWSLIFIAGSFSHAVLKRPASGDFRVQRDYGGSAEPAVPPASLIEDARAVVEAAARLAEIESRDVVYVRVDGVERAGRLLLMEFEAVEPVLFFGGAPGAAERMATALHALLAPLPSSGNR